MEKIPNIKRDVDEFSTPPVSALDLSNETVSSVNILINESPVDSPTRLKRCGEVNIDSYTPEYLFFKRRCYNCPNRLLEKADPRYSGFRWGGSMESIPDKYKKFYDPKEGYHSPSIKRDLMEILPIEIACRNNIRKDEMSPTTDHLVMSTGDLIDCQENLPKQFITSKDYFLAFKSNYEFFRNILPIENNITEIDENKFTFLTKFEKYAFNFSQVRLNLSTPGSVDGILGDPFRVLVRPIEGKNLPPLLCSTNDDEFPMEIVVMDTWVDHTPLEKSLGDIINYIYDSSFPEGRHYFNIDGKVILDVNISIINNAFNNADGYRIERTVVDPNINNYPCTKSPDSMPEFDATAINHGKRVVDSYRYSINFIQICE